MEQRYSVVTGLDIATPDPGRTPQYDGGFFGLNGGVPSSLRGPATGFVAECAFRLGDANGFPPSAPVMPVPYEYLCGSYDFTNQLGWAFVLFASSMSNITLQAYIGDQVLSFSAYPFGVVVARIEFDGTEANLYFNGIYVATTVALTYATGPNNFGIGGTPDASYVATFADDAWGCVNSFISGVRVAPFPAAAVGNVTRSPAMSDFLADQEARDITQSEDSVASPASLNLFSVRRGLPQLVDNGNEVWADEVSDTVLARIGTQEGASVRSMLGTV